MLQDITAQTYWRIAQNYTSLHVESCINCVTHFCSVTAACRGPYGRYNAQRCRGRDCTEEPHLSHAQHQWDEPDQHCAQHCLSACCWNWLGEYFTCVSMLSVCLAVCVCVACVGHIYVWCVCLVCWWYMACGMWNLWYDFFLLSSFFSDLLHSALHPVLPGQEPHCSAAAARWDQPCLGWRGGTHSSPLHPDETAKWESQGGPEALPRCPFQCSSTETGPCSVWIWCSSRGESKTHCA